MPKPKDGESKQAYISRFVSSEEAKGDFPDEKQRLAVGYSMWEHRNASFGFGQPKETPWPKKYSASFIEPGVVAYQDLGPCKVCGERRACGNEGDECRPEGATVLLKQDAIERMSKSFLGKPVIDVEHKDVTPDTIINGDADGIVTAVRLDEKSGWWMCDFLVWNPVTQKHCEDGIYSVSCAYNPTKTSGQGGEWHNVPYAEEILDGELTHLAIVTNPRYEGARITLVNSKGGKMDWKWFKRGERKNAAALDPLKTKVNVDGQDVALQELYDAAKEPEAPILNDDTILEVDGKEKTLGALKAAYRNKMKANADAEAKKEDEEKNNAGCGCCDKCACTGHENKADSAAGEEPLPDLRDPKAKDNAAKDKAAEEKKNADATAEKEALEKKNAEDARTAEEKKNAEEKAKADDELKQAADKALEEKRNAGRRAFAALRNAREAMAGVDGGAIGPVSIDERLAQGKKKYGSAS